MKKANMSFALSVDHHNQGSPIVGSPTPLRREAQVLYRGEQIAVVGATHETFFHSMVFGGAEQLIDKTPAVIFQQVSLHKLRVRYPHYDSSHYSCWDEQLFMGHLQSDWSTPLGLSPMYLPALSIGDPVEIHFSGPLDAVVFEGTMVS